MKAALDEAGVENESIVVKGAGHTFDLEKWCGKPLSEDVRSRVIAFFDRHLNRTVDRWRLKTAGLSLGLESKGDGLP